MNQRNEPLELLRSTDSVKRRNVRRYGASAFRPELRTLQRALALVLFPFLVSSPVSGAAGAQQEKREPQQRPAAQGGVSTGGVYAARKDDKARPITAGGFVDGAPVVFEDASAVSGLNGFVLRSGGEKKRYILETTSAGLALVDFDDDGWLDVYFVNGSTLEALAGKATAPGAKLYRNLRNGRFEDVTAKAGVTNGRWGMGVAAGDFDNDGWVDLYVTNYGKNRLYRNRGDGTFVDVAERAGVDTAGWSTGASFGDYDGDGLLDLFVAGYVDWDLENPPEPGRTATGYNFCTYRGVDVMCGPRGLKGETDRLYRNRGDGTFEDVSQKAGVSDPARYYGFGTLWFDADVDGDLDLAVANDSTANYLYLNRGDGTFEDASLPSGFALSENGREQAGMGLAVGDYDNDGLDDLYVTNFSDDSNSLYHNDGDGNFLDVTFQSGHGEPTIPFLGWGTWFLDFDNDGLKDLIAANGHVYPEVDGHDWGMTWAQRPLLFQNRDGKRFEMVVPATKSGLSVLRSARGAAVGDLDNDGDLDVVLTGIDEPAVLLRNVGATGNHWLSVKLVGGKGNPRDATGAVVTCVTGKRTQRGLVVSGGSYLSQSDSRVHFGLGPAKGVDRLEVRWPDGSVQTVKVETVDRTITVKQSVFAAGKGTQKTPVRDSGGRR